MEVGTTRFVGDSAGHLVKGPRAEGSQTEQSNQGDITGGREGTILALAEKAGQDMECKPEDSRLQIVRKTSLFSAMPPGDVLSSGAKRLQAVVPSL